MYVVTTTALENYGAHCESGKFVDGNAYWKFKSGTDYLVEGLDRPQDAMAFVAAIGMDNGIGWKEFPNEVMTLAEYRKTHFNDLESDFDREYYDFKMQYMKRVNPSDYIKEAA
jgi:hypothetical protein